MLELATTSPVASLSLAASNGYGGKLLFLFITPP